MIQRRIFVVLLVVAVCVPGCSEFERPSVGRNSNVNEHTFAKVCRDRTEASCLETLGNPDSEGPGELVQFTRPGDPTATFTIDERSEQEHQDFYKYFRGTQNEQIRLLYSGLNQHLLAAEYCLDNIPVFYVGNRPATCRALPVLAGAGGTRSPTAQDAEFAIRKKTVCEFFAQNFGSNIPTVAAMEPSPPEPSEPAPAPVEAAPTEVASAAPTVIQLQSPDPSGAPAAPPAPAVNQESTFAETLPGGRVWHDSTGKFSVEAELARTEGSLVVLKKAGGKELKLPVTRLCPTDMSFVDQWVQEKLAGIWNVSSEATTLAQRGGVKKFDSIETAKAAQMNSGFGGYEMRVRYAIADVTPDKNSQVRLNLNGDGSIWPGIVRTSALVPLSTPDAMRVPKGSFLVAEGKLSFKNGTCPSCNGSKTVKCHNCVGGTVRIKYKVPIRNGTSVGEVREGYSKQTCQACGGRGQFPCETCGNIFKEDWTPMRTSPNKGAPHNAVAALSNDNGAKRCYVLLDDLELKIVTSKSEIPLKRNPDNGPAKSAL